MPSTQALLQAITDMQANAQRALPVIPNNGNPMGANNMPHNTGIVPPHMRDSQKTPPTRGVPAGGVEEKYPWLKPSPSMENIRQNLSRRRAPPQTPPAPIAPTPPVFNAPVMVDPVDRPISLPVMPMQAAVM